MTDNTKMQENLRKLAELAKCEVAQVGDKLFYSAALPCDAGTVRPLPTSPDTMDIETVLTWLAKAGYKVTLPPIVTPEDLPECPHLDHEVEISKHGKRVAGYGDTLREALGNAVAALELEEK